MKSRDIDIFFKELNAELHFPLEVILTGGAAAILQGVDRATNDIDFELHLKNSKEKPSGDDIVKALRKVTEKTKIAAQFSDDISRWSMIVIPSKETIPNKQIGQVKIMILSPSV